MKQLMQALFLSSILFLIAGWIYACIKSPFDNFIKRKYIAAVNYFYSKQQQDVHQD